MATLAPGITVNGVHIPPERINAEVQYHPAVSIFDAKYQAMQALVIRELLIQEAVHLGLSNIEEANLKPDDVIDRLLQKCLNTPEPTPEECKRYYNKNIAKFRTSPLFEVSHILYLAPPNDDAARKKAKEKADNVLKTITDDPALFERIAKEESACQSGKNGGHLGQISKGETLPAFEAALHSMKTGDISSAPVSTEVGYHIIKVHKRVDGKKLPYELVEDWIAKSLKEQSWRRAFNQYVQLLAGKSHISGFKLKSADTPLVQ